MNGKNIPARVLPASGGSFRNPLPDPQRGTAPAWSCVRCGRDNVVMARFCGGCGAVSGMVLQPANHDRDTVSLASSGNGAHSDQPWGVFPSHVPVARPAAVEAPHGRGRAPANHFSPQVNGGPPSADRGRGGPASFSPGTTLGISGAQSTGGEGHQKVRGESRIQPDACVPAKELPIVAEPPGDVNEPAQPPPRRAPRKFRWRRLIRVSSFPAGWKVALVGVGVFLLLPILVMALQATPGGHPLDSPVLWSDFQSYLSRNLAITLAEVEILARGAWNEVPLPQAPLSVQQARKIEEVLNRKEVEKIRFLVPNSKDGPLQWASLENGPAPAEEGRFLDVSLDHPVYAAWGTLMKLGLKLATGNGQARPYEALRWDEWEAVLDQLGRLSGTDDRPLGITPSDRQGEMQNSDFQRSLLELRAIFGIPVPARGENSPAMGIPTRLEAFGALASLLNELELNDPDPHQ